MKFKLNKWQTITLFLPYFIAVVFMMRLPIFGRPFLLLANIFMVFNITLVHGYQVYLANSFNAQQPKPSKIYKINLFIPLSGLVIYFLDVVRVSVISPERINFGPMHGLSFNWYLDTLYIVLIYAGLNYFFFNAYFVAKQIGKTDNVDKKDELTKNYLIPIRKLIRLSIWALLSGLAVAVIVDIVTLF